MQLDIFRKNVTILPGERNEGKIGKVTMIIPAELSAIDRPIYRIKFNKHLSGEYLDNQFGFIKTDQELYDSNVCLICFKQHNSKQEMIDCDCIYSNKV